MYRSDIACRREGLAGDSGAECEMHAGLLISDSPCVNMEMKSLWSMSESPSCTGVIGTVPGQVCRWRRNQRDSQSPPTGRCQSAEHGYAVRRLDAANSGQRWSSRTSQTIVMRHEDSPITFCAWTKCRIRRERCGPPGWFSPVLRNA